MNLQQVKPPFVVTLPTSMWNQSDTQVRAKPGDVIDLDVPGEAELLAGQMHKLEPAPAGAVPTESAVKIPRIAIFLREAAAKAAKEAAAGAAPAAAPVAAHGAPASPQAPAAAQPPQPTPGPAPRAPARPAAKPAQPGLPDVDPLPNVPAKA